MIRSILLDVKHAHKKYKRRIMMNDNGQYKLALKKKYSSMRSHTNFYSDNKYNVMIAILSFFSCVIYPKEEKKRKKNKLLWSSRNLYKVRTKKENKNERKT
jgi:hypothetical protein